MNNLDLINWHSQWCETIHTLNGDLTQTVIESAWKNTSNNTSLRRHMNNISFETALELIVRAYMASAMLLLAASNICLAVIETIEEIGD